MTGRTVENDVRLLANYARLAERIAVRITGKEVVAMPDTDLYFLMYWAESAGSALSNLGVSCRAESRDRPPDETRRLTDE